MNEWRVIEVLIALTGLYGCIYKPLKSLERLNTLIEALRDQLVAQDNNLRDMITKLDTTLSEQQRVLSSHGEKLAAQDARIKTLEEERK